jgi:hypothetical protein
LCFATVVTTAEARVFWWFGPLASFVAVATAIAFSAALLLRQRLARWLLLLHVGVLG